MPGQRARRWPTQPRLSPRTFVFTNDFPALLPEGQADPHGRIPLLRRQPQSGTCRVVCFSPRHDLTLAELAPEAIGAVDRDLGASRRSSWAASYAWVQVFENKGELMGASNPHPHGQIWASEPCADDAGARRSAARRTTMPDPRSPLLVDYAAEEARRAESASWPHRMHWLAVVPFWAVWPFEILLAARGARVARLPDLTTTERADLAGILKRLLVRYDNLFEVLVPVLDGLARGAVRRRRHPGWQLHAHFYPPLLRSAEVRKFLVGYEMLAEPQRDLTAEQAAERLRMLPDVRFDARDTGTR